MLKLRSFLKRRTYYCFVVMVLVLLFYSSSLSDARRSYDVILREDILGNLYVGTAQNFTSTAVLDCEYRDLYLDETLLSPKLVDGDMNEGHKIKDGGVFAPADCKPRFSVAIIVPYRDRVEQLRGFLIYMHQFLRKQRIHYRIFIVEQVDTYEPYNRGKLLNVGAKAAMKAGYPCLILHDVDLLPLRQANLYACTKCPRHMSSNIVTFRFPYTATSSSAIAITMKQFKTINGVSNKNYGWSEDLYSRLEVHELKVCQLEPELSQYHIAEFRSETKWEKTKEDVSYTNEEMTSDGLSSLHYTEVATVLHPLFTHIMVDLACQSKTDV